MDLDVGEVGVNTECQVGSKGVRCGCPGKQGGRWVIDQGEGDSDCASALEFLHAESYLPAGSLVSL